MGCRDGEERDGAFVGMIAEHAAHEIGRDLGEHVVAEIGAGRVMARVTARMSAKRTRTVTVRQGRSFARKRRAMRSARCCRTGRNTFSVAGLLTQRRLRAGGYGAAVGLNFARILIPRERGEFAAGGAAKHALHRLRRGVRQLADGLDAVGGEALLGRRPHAPHQVDGQIVQKHEFGVGIDDDQAIGLGHLRGDLGQMLGARHAD